MYFRQCAVFKHSELQNIVNSYEEGQDILIGINGYQKVIFKDKNTGKMFRDPVYIKVTKTVYAIMSDYLRDYVGRDVKIIELNHPDGRVNEIEVTFE